MQNSNIKKEAVLMNQFINKSQIRILNDGGRWDKIQKIFDDARSIAERQGKRNYHNEKVHTSLVIELLDIDEGKIHKYAKLERQIKKDASCVEKAASQIDN